MECESNLDPVPYWLEIHIQEKLLDPIMHVTTILFR
jgi:hypothetical protein